MKTVEIYIVSHKIFKWNSKPGYLVLSIGKNQTFGDVHDNIGLNISGKNANFCELTGLYWIWKNSNADITGLVHYRRFFTTNILSTSPNYFLTPKRIISLLNKYDLIATPFYHFKKTILENRKEFCYEKDIICLKEVIKEKTPDYLEAFEKVFNGHRSYLCNMMIAKRNLLENYCDWLFSILFELDKRINTSSYTGNYARVFGYLSEPLLTVFAIKNKLKVKSCSIAYTDRSFLKRLLNKFTNGIRK